MSQLVLFKDVYKEVNEAFDLNLKHFTEDITRGWKQVLHNSINWFGEIGLLGYMRLYK